MVESRALAALSQCPLRNVPEGQYDCSLARSAWDSATPKSRPVGYGMISIGVRTDRMGGIAKQNGAYRLLASAHYEMSRRDSTIVAWHAVPGTAPPQRAVPQGTV
jgi:hypothetical protein